MPKITLSFGEDAFGTTCDDCGTRHYLTVDRKRHGAYPGEHTFDARIGGRAKL